MTITAVSKDAAAQGGGVGPFVAGIVGTYTAGQWVQIWIRHRSSIANLYLTNAADVVGNRFPIAFDATPAGPNNTDGNETLQFALVQVPNNGVTYDRVNMLLSGTTGATGNWVKTKCFAATGSIQHDKVGDLPQNPSGTTGQPANITHIDMDVSGSHPTGNAQMLFAGSATSAATNSGNVSLRPDGVTASGFTENSVEPSSVRGLTAWKILTSVTNPGSSGLVRLSWSAGTVAVGLMVTVQETAAVTQVKPAGLHFYGNGHLMLNPAVQSTTRHIPASLQMVAFEKLTITPRLRRYTTLGITVTQSQSLALTLSSGSPGKTTITLTPTVTSTLAPALQYAKAQVVQTSVTTSSSVAVNDAHRATLAITVTQAISLPLVVTAPIATDPHNWEWEAGRVEVPWEAEEVGTWQSE